MARLKVIKGGKNETNVKFTLKDGAKLAAGAFLFNVFISIAAVTALMIITYLLSK